ncbi:hypothetical protein PENSPDRAFT_647718 [Peniophora sp. CONT]|nr:hypothetical protein PENSPDRAFT_647718 [Peniophora sp. CONT]
MSFRTPRIFIGLNGSTISVPFGETDMDTIIRRFHALKTRQNAHSSACKLPPELFYLIFEDLAAISPMQPSVNSLWDKIGWAVITQVCHRWRSAAIAHKVLWAHIELGSMPARFLNLMAKRAGDYPLKVTCTSHRFPGATLIPRMRALDIHGFDGVTSLLQKLSSFPPLPLLEHIRLVPDQGIYNSPGLTSNFIEYTVPNLAGLTMKFIRFPWGTTAPRLRRLELIQTRVVRLDFIFQGLKCLPDLEVLVFDDIDISAPPDDYVSVECPQLRHLVIKGPPNECNIFWCSIVTHPSAFVHIDASRACDAPIYPDTGDLADLATEAGCQFDSELFGDRPTFSRLRMSADKLVPKCHIQIDDEKSPGGLYGSSDRPTSQHPHPNAGLQVILPVPHGTHETFHRDFTHGAFETMVRFISAIPPQDWRTLEMQGTMSWVSQPIIDLLRHISAIQTLRFDHCTDSWATAELCKHLDPFYGIEPDGEPVIRLPNLTSIFFDHVPFLCPQCDGKIYSLIEPMGTLLKTRNDLGHGVKYLRITSGSVLADYVSKWEGLVDKLEWDNDEGDAHSRHADLEDEEDLSEDDEEEEAVGSEDVSD